MTATIYTTSTCAFCPMVKKFLKMKGVDYREVNIEDDRALQDSLFKLTGATTVPITSFGDRYVIGWNAAALAKAIQENK